jgi:hypothetical protein
MESRSRSLAIGLGRNQHDRTTERDLDNPGRHGQGLGGRRIGCASTEFNA